MLPLLLVAAASAAPAPVTLDACERRDLGAGTVSYACPRDTTLTELSYPFAAEKSSRVVLTLWLAVNGELTFRDGPTSFDIGVPVRDVTQLDGYTRGRGRAKLRAIAMEVVPAERLISCAAPPDKFEGCVGLLTELAKRAPPIPDREAPVPFTAAPTSLLPGICVRNTFEPTAKCGDAILQWLPASAGPWEFERTLDYYTSELAKKGWRAVGKEDIACTSGNVRYTAKYHKYDNPDTGEFDENVKHVYDAYAKFDGELWNIQCVAGAATDVANACAPLLGCVK